MRNMPGRKYDAAGPKTDVPDRTLVAKNRQFCFVTNPADNVVCSVGLVASTQAGQLTRTSPSSLSKLLVKL